MLYQCHRIAAWFWKIAKWMIPLNNLPPYLLSQPMGLQLILHDCHIKAINKIFHHIQMYSYLTKYIATSAKKSVSKAKWIFPKSLSALLENFYSHLSVSQGRTDFITKKSHYLLLYANASILFHSLRMSKKKFPIAFCNRKIFTNINSILFMFEPN